MKNQTVHPGWHFGALAILLVFGFINVGSTHAGSAKPATYSVLFTFDGSSNGSQPAAPLIHDAAGNLYGTTRNEGVVFKLDAAGNQTVLHTFFDDGRDGYGPIGALVQDAVGNLYGTTSFGGSGRCFRNQGCGIVFRIDPTGRETVLYRFHGSDGGNPWAGLTKGPGGILYGTTNLGGEHHAGVVFRLDPDGTETVLHHFGGKSGGVFDGAYPYAGLITDDAGNLYGEASAGGPGNCGIVFKLDPSGVETVLYSFTGPDGCGPQGGLSRDAAGNLYGTTPAAGAGNSGVVFKLDPAGTQTVVYAFAGGTDGYGPAGGVIVDKAGNLYGVTEFGGPPQGCTSGVILGCGIVYKLDPAGHKTVLHAFRGACPSGDGSSPEAGLLFFGGSFYGTASYGGSSDNGCDTGAGIVFKIGP